MTAIRDRTATAEPRTATGRYALVLATAVLCYAALGAVLGILPNYVQSLGGGAVLVGLAVGAPALTGAAGRPLGGRLADRHGLVIPGFGIGVIASRTVLAGIPDRFGAARTLSGAVVLEAVGLAGLAAASTAPLALVALVVMAVGQGLAVPSLGLIALEAVPPSRHGRTAGAFFCLLRRGGRTRRTCGRPRRSRRRPDRCVVCGGRGRTVDRAGCLARACASACRRRLAATRRERGYMMRRELVT